MKYNIIGDIHGMRTWRKLAKKDYVNIFVGDYFSPYPRLRKKEGIELPDGMDEDIPYIDKDWREVEKLKKWYEVYTPTFDELKRNFLDIVKFKKANPETTLLLVGNHDEDHWHIQEGISRHDRFNCQSINNLFNKYKDFFTVAYNIEDKALVTHAGVSAFWYENIKDNANGFRNFDRIVVSEVGEDDDIRKVYERFAAKMFEGNKSDAIIQWNNKLWRYVKDSDEFREINPTVQEVCDLVNETWRNGDYYRFDFNHNCDINDTYGYSKQQSPMWLRDKTLALNNIFMFRDVKQFVGHTQHEKVLRCGNIGFVDSLQFGIQSIVYDSEIDKMYKNVGKKKLIELVDIKNK